MQRDEILRQAEQLVNGKRAEDYGDAYENHCRNLGIQNGLLGQRSIQHD